MTSVDLFIIGMIFGICAVTILVWASIKCIDPKKSRGHIVYSGRIILNTKDPYAEIARMELDMDLVELTEQKEVVLQVVKEE